MEKLVEAKHIQHPMCEDDTGATAGAYQVQGIPTFVLIDKTGAVASTGHSVPTAEQIEALLAK